MGRINIRKTKNKSNQNPKRKKDHNLFKSEKKEKKDQDPKREKDNDLLKNDRKKK